MNIDTFLSVIYDKIAASTSTEETLILSKIAEKIKINNVRVASSYGDMISNAQYVEGTLFFVEDENVLYYTSGSARLPVLSLNNRLFGWGSSSSGQLGDAATLSRSSPVSVVGGFTDWVQVAPARLGSSTVAIRSNGTLWAWGNNAFGQLGDGTSVSKSSPVSVIGGFVDWLDVSNGTGHVLGLRSNGTLWSWGGGFYGKLGDGTTVSRSSPVSVVGGFTDWVQASASTNHSAAVRANGTIWAWGVNTDGQLGDNSTTNKSSPVSVVGGYSDWVQVATGTSHTVGVRSNGTAWAWGNNSAGQLGDGTNTGSSSPVSVVGGFTSWSQVSAGNAITSGLLSDGTAWAWGANATGQLGDNTTVSKSSPVSVAGGFTDWTQISAGSGNNIALRANGTAWAWGSNSFGGLGDNTATNRSSPVPVSGGFTDWVAISNGSNFAHGIRITR